MVSKLLYEMRKLLNVLWVTLRHSEVVESPTGSDVLSLDHTPARQVHSFTLGVPFNLDNLVKSVYLFNHLPISVNVAQKLRPPRRDVVEFLSELLFFFGSFLFVFES